MKKEFKRYFLVEYCDTIREIKVSSYEEVLQMLNEVRKYNNRKTSNFLFGNIDVIKNEDGSYIMTAHIYKKYTDRQTISQIDELTSEYDEKEIASMFKDKSRTKEGFLPDINIAYFETDNRDENGKVSLEKGIRYLPVLYKEDTKYLNDGYIRGCLYYHTEINDLDFFRDLANEFRLHHFVGDKIEKLRIAIDKCEHEYYPLNQLYYAACDLYDKFIHEYEKDESLARDKNGKYIISRRRLRDFGFFVKNYGLRYSKIKSPLMYNMPRPKPEYIEEESGQLKLRLK